MDQSSGEGYPGGFIPSDEISLVEIANTILRNWRMIAVLPVTLALVIGLWTVSQDRTYSASASVVPQAAEGRSAGGASALAQQFGVSLDTDRPGQSPHFYADVLQSLAILRKAVESEYEVPGENGGARTATLLEPFEANESGALPPWRRAVDRVRGTISTCVARETGVVRLTLSAAHPVLSEQIAQRLLELLNEFSMEARQSRAQEEGRFISGRLAEAQAELLAAEWVLQEFLRQNRKFRNSPELLFDHDKLQRQVAMRQPVRPPVPYLKEWDTCAPEVILTEAGGHVSDCPGEPLRNNKADPRQSGGISACAPGCVDAVLAEVRHLFEAAA